MNFRDTEDRHPSLSRLVDQIAEFISISEEEITAYNPISGRELFPGRGEVWALNLQGKIPEFRKRGKSGGISQSLRRTRYELEPVYYKVKSGDVLALLLRNMAFQ